MEYPALTMHPEEWNGSGWSSTPSIILARNGLGGVDTEPAGLGFGGYTTGP